MKVAVTNFSGNVGKTTVSGELLKHRMKTARMFSVESINYGLDSNGTEVEKIKGKRYGELLDELMLEESAIVDIGASNVEDFFKLMQQYHGSHEEFDYFVIPVVKEGKVQIDTVNTIRSLQRLGIDKNRIKTIFNKVDMDDDIKDEFKSLFGLAELEGSFIADEKAAIYTNEVFERLKDAGKSLSDITEDKTDYRAQLRKATNDEEKTECIKMIALKRLAVTANDNLDDVFETLFN